MKERASWPMKAHEVRAILNGSKTQVRLVVKPQPPVGAEHWSPSNVGHPWHDIYGHNGLAVHRVCFPYGKPGDRLWAREAFAEEYDYCNHPEMPGAPTEHFHFGWHYRADGSPVESSLEGFLSPWKPSIHMPRCVSRITLEITGVRVERLQDISEADARAEGFDGIGFGDRDHPAKSSAKFSFWNLWKSINGPGSWDANPWVWVVEFKRVTQ